MDFAFDARTEELRSELLEFMEVSVYPAERLFHEQLAALENHWAWTSVPVLGDLRARARSRGLWNLFLPGEHGAGLTNLQYAPLAEVTGRSICEDMLAAEGVTDFDRYAYQPGTEPEADLFVDHA